MAVMIVSNCPDKAVAEKIAMILVEQRLAACVQIGPPVTSIYRWKGKLERSQEIGLLAKTSLQMRDKAISKIRELHPFEVPEILSIPIDTGLPEYLQWVQAETVA